MRATLSRPAAGGTRRGLRTGRGAGQSPTMTALLTPPTLRQLPAAVCAALLDPDTSETDLAALLEQYPIPDTYAALLHRPRLHSAVVTAARGEDAGYELLHYAVLDAQPATWSRALELAESDPATWEVLVPALAAAPAATRDQLTELAQVVATNRDGNGEVNAETCRELLDRLIADAQPTAIAPQVPPPAA